MNAERPSDRASSRSGHYDFQRLERSVKILLDEHERLSAEHEGLLEELVDRECRIHSLEAKLRAEGERRVSAAQSVDRILGRLQAIELQVTAFHSSDDPEDSSSKDGFGEASVESGA